MQNNDCCYFDYNASTPVHPLVTEKYLSALSCFANPSSAHLSGEQAFAEIANAKNIISKALNCKPNEIWFTSGGTESNNWILKGLTDKARQKNKNHIIVSSIEHKSILKTAQYLSDVHKIEITVLPVNKFGCIEVDSLKMAIKPNTFLVSVMLANNETGVVQPINEIAGICREHNIFIHTDAVSAIGKIPINFKSSGVDALSLSSHKLYAPKGTGVLILKENIEIEPLIHGCGQQNSMRSGTENAPGAAAFGKSMDLMMKGEYNAEQTKKLTFELQENLKSTLKEKIIFHGDENKLGNTLSVAFIGVSGIYLQKELSKKGIYVSAGSAASTGAPSHVLTAMGISAGIAQSTLRISLGWNCTSKHVSLFLNGISEILSNNKSLEPIKSIKNYQTEKIQL